MAAQEFTPELNEEVLNAIKARIEETRLQQIGAAKGSATAAGLSTGSSYQAVREGAADRGASMGLADAYANMALEKAKLQREERLIQEGQTFQVGQSEAERKFTAEQNVLGREFQAQQGQIDRDNANANARRDRRAGIISSGLGAAGGGLGMAFGLCFAPDTPVEMADGTTKPIKDIVLGDETRGGTVASVRYALAPDEMFSYLGVITTGVHAVNENGKWIRVGDSRLALPVQKPSNLVFDLGTTKHRIWIKGVEFADDFETNNFFEIYDRPSIEQLNIEERVKGKING